MCISDIALALGTNIQVYLREFFPYVNVILRDPKYDPESKLQAISTMGDLAMYGENVFVEGYLSEALTLLMEQCQESATTDPSKEQDREVVAYTLKHRSVIIDAYVNILVGVSETQIPQGKHILAQQLGALFNYIVYICDASQQPPMVSNEFLVIFI